VQSLKFEHEAQEVAFADCIAEVLHMGERLARLDKAIDRLVASAPAHMQAVIEALQALHGIGYGSTSGLKRLLPTLPAGVAAIAWKAQERLHKKFARMTFHRKHAGTVASAVARELVGFIWAIGSMVESQHVAKTKAQAAWSEVAPDA
jgi:hypothetical protein